MIRRPPRSTRVRSSAASDVYKRQGLRCSDLCKTSCRDRQRSSRVAFFSFNANVNALDAGDCTLGLLPWLKKTVLKKCNRLEWLAKANWARYACRSSLARAECLEFSALKCITPLNARYRSCTRLRARASRERIRLDLRSVQILHILMTDNHINIRPDGYPSVDIGTSLSLIHI